MHFLVINDEFYYFTTKSNSKNPVRYSAFKLKLLYTIVKFDYMHFVIFKMHKSTAYNKIFSTYPIKVVCQRAVLALSLCICNAHIQKPPVLISKWTVYMYIIIQIYAVGQKNRDTDYVYNKTDSKSSQFQSTKIIVVEKQSCGQRH